MFKNIRNWRNERKEARLRKKLEKTSSRLQSPPTKTSNRKRSLQLTQRQALWIKIIATVVLTGIMIAGFYVSFGTLVTFAVMFGKVGEAAIIIALILDTLAVLGLGITLLFPSTSSKVAFLGGVGASSVMNVYIGFTIAGPVGAIVAVIPQLATVLGERVVFDLLFEEHDEASTPQQETSTQLQEELEDGLEILEDYQEPEVVILENPMEEFWVVPDTVEELQKKAPAPATASTKPPVGFTPYSKEQVVEILVDRGDTPGRPTIMREFGVSDWTARQIVTEMKNN